MLHRPPTKYSSHSNSLIVVIISSIPSLNSQFLSTHCALVVVVVNDDNSKGFCIVVVVVQRDNRILFSTTWRQHTTFSKPNKILQINVYLPKEFATTARFHLTYRIFSTSDRPTNNRKRERKRMYCFRRVVTEQRLWRQTTLHNASQRLSSRISPTFPLFNDPIKWAEIKVRKKRGTEKCLYLFMHHSLIFKITPSTFPSLPLAPPPTPAKKYLDEQGFFRFSISLQPR